MSFENEQHKVEDVELESALKHFRQSVHGWSEREYSRARTVAPVRAGFWIRLRKPIVAGALGCVVAVTAITVPVSVHHQRKMALEQEMALREQKRLADAAAQRAAAINDDKLLADVDSDIEQATPDAFQPLASLMSDSTAK
jgi:hypothetical protein